MTIQPITVSQDLKTELDYLQNRLFGSAEIEHIHNYFFDELSEIELPDIKGFRNKIMYMLATNCYKLQEYQYYVILSVRKDSQGNEVFSAVNSGGVIQDYRVFEYIPKHTVNSPNNFKGTKIPRHFQQFALNAYGIENKSDLINHYAEMVSSYQSNTNVI